MSDTTRPNDATTGLPTLIPPQARAEVDDRDRDGVDVTPDTHRPAEQLGFQMRFEGGKALLALEDRVADDGIVVRRALFEVPDVAFPLDVSGGALRFQNKRLTLRAVELAVTWDALFVEGDLARHGMTLVRERSRAGGLELIVALAGPAGPVPIRARCIFAPVGDGGVALVLHELLGFLPLPRRRLDLAPALLDALRFPGGLPARAMIRRAEPFRAVFSRLLPMYGWKVPSLGDVRVHEAVLGKGEVVLRAWSGPPPEGWRAPRPHKKGPLQEAISLAIFADGLAAAGDEASRLRLVDRLIDEKALSSSAIPFTAEVLRADPRRRADGDDLIARALEADEEHLGLLAAWAEAVDIPGLERARRLLKLSAAADANDEPWVAGRAAIGAARLAEAAGEVEFALEAANAAVEADPSVAEAGMFLSRLLAEHGELERALVAGRAALERAGSGSIIEPAADLEASDSFAIELAAVAKVVEGHDAARLLLRRALRQRERADALVPLVELEIDAGALERAAEGLARLLTVVDSEPGIKKHVELLAARLAEARGDRETARAHLLIARDLDPKDAWVALRLARLAEDAGDIDRAADALAVVLDDEGVEDRDLTIDERAALAAARFAAARLALKRAWRGGPGAKVAAERTRGLVARLPAPRRGDADVVRLDTEARAILGDSGPLGELLLQEASDAQDRRAGHALRIEAAKHLLDAGRVDAAAACLAEAFVDGDMAAADLVVERAPGTAALVAEFGRSVLGCRPTDIVVTDAVHALARRLGAAGRPGDAFHLLDGRSDQVSRQLRAQSARDHNDVDAEITERQALAELVDADRLGAQLVRLAVLLQRRERFGDAADAWSSAAAASADPTAVIDVVAWQEAAVRSGDPTRLALVIVREDADISRLDSPTLRAAIEAVQDLSDRRRLYAILASRNDQVSDVARWLDAARQLPVASAAAAFIEAGRRNQRADWLLEGVELLMTAGDIAGALAAMKAVSEGGVVAGTDVDNSANTLATNVAVARRALEIALAADDAEAIEAFLQRLLSRADLGVDEQRACRRRVMAAHAAHGDVPGRQALLRQGLQRWLDVEPALLEPLSACIETLCTSDDGDLDTACGRLEAARAAGAGDEARDLVNAVADAARDRGVPAEMRARELLLGFELDDAARERIQRRLVDLSVRTQNCSRAIELLHALVAQATARSAADSILGGLWQRIADLEDEEQRNPRAAADALVALLGHVPIDAVASRRLLALLVDLKDDAGLAAESLRRAAILPPSMERSDLLLRAADVYSRGGHIVQARAIGLRALRSAPFSMVALDQVADLAKQTQSRRLAIRARLAAARTLRDSTPADAARHAAEAGGLLAGVLRRHRLAVAAYAFADDACTRAGVATDSHARMLVELCRALSDGEGAKRWLDRLVAGAEGKEQARLLEARADVSANLLSDHDAAIADRRQALSIDPTYAAAARGLSRHLAARGQLREAIDVERRFINATASGEVRSIAYARLATMAHAGSLDPALVAELCAVALSERDDLEVRRLQAAAFDELGDVSASITALEGLRALATDPLERLSVGRRLAHHHRQRGDSADAITALQAIVDDAELDALVLAHGVTPLPPNAGYDHVVVDLAHLRAARGELSLAASTLLRGLGRLPDAEALSPRHTLLEQAGSWLDDDDGGDQAERALAVLCDADDSGGLSDDGEVRRARLAEELDQPAIACAAIASLVSRHIDVSTNARRLAHAAEAMGDLRRALTSWQRALVADDDVDANDANDAAVRHNSAWTNIERLAVLLDDRATARQAMEALLVHAHDDAATQAARAVACAEDALAREGDRLAAIGWLDRARQHQGSAVVRARLLELSLAELATAAPSSLGSQTLALLDEMVDAGDDVTVSARLKRADLRLGALDVDADADAARIAIEDILAAVDGAAENGVAIAAGVVDDLLSLAVAAAPRSVALALAGLPGQALLRDALIAAGGLDDASIDDALLLQLADDDADSEALQRAAARRLARAGHPAAAADRLFGLAARHIDSATIHETQSLIDDATVLAIAGGSASLLARLPAARPSLARWPERRDQALALLRDLERWDHVAVVLDDAVEASPDAAERRRLRLQLVSVLREGVDTEEAHRSAATYLGHLVDEDNADREAWGELFECLEGLGDLDALQQAIGRRADVLGPAPSHLEARQLVRRRAELLLKLGRAHEAVAALAAVRLVGDDDETLRGLLAQLHGAIDGFDRSGPSSVAFLHAELHASHRLTDARAILALPPDAVVAHSPGLRVEALATLALVDDDSADSVVQTMCATAWPAHGVARRHDEVLQLAVALATRSPEAAQRLLVRLASELTAWGSTAALDLTDALFANDSIVSSAAPTLAARFALPGFVRRVRTRGTAATAVDIDRLGGRGRDVAAFRRAARLGDAVALGVAANALGVPLAIGAAARAQVVDELDRVAVARNAARPASDIATALVRHGDPRAAGWLDQFDESGNNNLTAQTAARCAGLSLHGPARAFRLPIRLRLASRLHSPAADLAAIASAALSDGNRLMQAEALDQLFQHRPATPRELVARADAAAALGADDAAAFASAAAAVADVEDAVRLRRRAIEVFLRTGDQDRLGAELLALARSAPAGVDGDLLRAEARNTAEAARLTDVVDAILGAAESPVHGVAQRVAAVKERAALRLRRKDPLGAFVALRDAARTMGDDLAAADLLQEAWRTATAEGLTMEALEALEAINAPNERDPTDTDVLARAAMLGLMGRIVEARSLATTLTTPAAFWLLADLARLTGDAAAEDEALERLVDHGAADDGVAARLIDASRRRGDIDAAARRSLGLCGRGLNATRLGLLLDCADGAAPSLRADAAHALMGAMDADVAPGVRLQALAGAVRLSEGLDDAALRREARLLLARATDSEAGWVALVVANVRDLAADDSIIALERHFTRPGVLRGVIAALAGEDDVLARLAAGLAGLVRSGDAARVVDVLTPLPSRPWRISDVLAGALVLTGKNRDAADVLLAAVVDGAPRRQTLIRASELLVEAGAFAAAARALGSLMAQDLDDTVLTHARTIVTLAARDGAMDDGARLAAHLGRIAADDTFVTLALGLADAAGGDTAISIAAERLRRRDARGLAILAHHSLDGSAAQGYFGAWHALRCAVRSFAPHAPAGFERVAAMEASRDVDQPPLPPPALTVLQRARQGGRAARQHAWHALAAEVATVDELASARLLVRAGVPMAEAPLVVRLAVDPALATDHARAAAIAAQLASVVEARRPAIVAAFDVATSRGATTARQRLAVDAVASRMRPPLLTALDHLAVGDAVDLTALVKGLGRHPSASARAQAAIIARIVGHDDVARAIDPSCITAVAASDASILAAMRSPNSADDDLTTLGRLRLSQLAGPRTDVEERIAALAMGLGRTDLLAESLLRLARLHSSRVTRAAVLVRHAQLLQTTDVVAAERSARSAFALVPSQETAAIVTTLAEAGTDVAALERALAAQAVATVDDDSKTALIVRRANLLAHRMLQPEDAIILLDDRLAEAPSWDLHESKALIFEHLLNQPRDAGLSLLAVVDFERDRMPAAQRNLLRRRASSLLQREGSADAIALAVAALGEAAADGDVDALDDAEALARERAHGEVLARVLDLRLSHTDDVNARRVLVLERARLLREIDDPMGAYAVLEAHAVADPIDLGARLTLAEWYLNDRRVLDAALAFESAARIPGLPAAGFGPPAREAASLLGALGDLDRAGPLAEMAVRAGDVDLNILSVAEAWNRSKGHWAAVDELLGRELEHIADPRREAHVWMERASIRHAQLADEPGTKKALGQVLALVPDHPRALQMLRDDANRTDIWGSLRMALLRAVDVNSDPRRQAGWLRDIAVIDAEHLGDVVAAEASIERALACDPDHVDCLIFKATLMVTAGRVDGVSAIMDRIEKQGGKDGPVVLPGRLHLMRGDALVVAGDRMAAQAALRLATDDPETSSRAWDRLIDMADGTAAALTLIDEARKATLDPARQLSLWRKDLRLQQRLGDDGAATAAAAQVLALAPDDDDALAVLKDAYTRRRKQRDLLPFLTAHARASSDAVQRASRLTDTATFCLDDLGQESAARLLFEEALGLDPAQPTALIRLADIAWASRDDERALDLLDRIAPEQWLAAPGDDHAVRAVTDLYLRRARCAWALGHADVRERLRQVLRVDAKHVAALELLAKVALDAQDDDGAEWALESLGNAIRPDEDPVRLSSVLVDHAQLRLRRGKPGDALAAAERAADLNPTNRTVLETVARVREAAGRFVDAAEAWRRLAALRSGTPRLEALEQRVALLQKTDRTKDTIDAWLDLYGESGDPSHKAAALAAAQNSGQADVLARVGATIETEPVTSVVPEQTQTEAMPVAPGSSSALVIQLRANMDVGDHTQALQLALDAREVHPLDAESTRLAMEAARTLGRHSIQVDLAESHLQAATSPREVRDVALEAGRVARDALHDDDRAAALLYQAHQADAEDVEVRLELTTLYARIPRLATHAVTGILQLLRRTPADARVFALAADLADSQGQAERAQAMRGVQAILSGTGAPLEHMAGRWADERMPSGIVPLDRETISTKLAPTGWGGPLHRLLTLLGMPLEAVVGSLPAPAGAKPLVQASPRSAGMLERIDALLPGRAVQVLMADVDRPAVCAAAVPMVVVPRDVLVNDAALYATIARGVAVVRMGAMVSELVSPGSEGDLVDLLKAGLLGIGPSDARSQSLTAGLTEEQRQAVTALATQIFVGAAPVDIAGTLQTMARACDRFALVATGSAIAALQAGCLPSLVKDPPQRATTRVQGNVRALDLCAFAARDNAWSLRHKHLLGDH